jgi:hypothetical protein
MALKKEENEEIQCPFQEQNVLSRRLEFSAESSRRTYLMVEKNKNRYKLP